jgi:hypothetical protein
MTHDSRQAGELTNVEITPQMIEAGVAFCSQEYEWTDRRLAEVTRSDMRRILSVVLGRRG